MRLTGADLPVHERLEPELQRQWEFLAAPGATMTGPERVDVARRSRAAHDGELAAADDAVATMTVAAHTVTPEWVADEVGRRSAAEVVETLGIVARLTAIDTAVRGLGAERVPLPEGTTGDPTGAVDPEAKVRSAALPTVGGANPLTVLSHVPAERDHQLHLSSVLYMSSEEMGDLDIERDLHRTQLELVAARTSLVNECVY